MESAVDESVDHYPVMQHLSKGSSCQVFLSKDDDDNKVALKVLNHDLREDMLEHCLEEFPTMKHLDHANILKVFAYDKGSYRAPESKTKRVHYAVMELAEGGTLYDYVDFTKGFEEPLARVYFK